MPALEFPYRPKSLAANSTVNRKETVAAAILDYLHVEQTLHGPYVFVPVHRTFLWVSYGVVHVPVQLLRLRSKRQELRPAMSGIVRTFYGRPR